ncbi:uncharacterized protein FA14DRAFT_191493 [Meira miltonrushii]|uniref:Transcription factor TFIIIC triple barrel domain-containing protein n=1 Tax=Meira miltonrushii TaxID=1280837 RepID=A0A316VA48_9BASI|nr:uncharacterized protein FA14DRAFT_191493 [Meira miltonrushii]PWN34447.1 hypothetical protein FA14DRAFT_191493 [Meira miltonrushii]
MTFTDSREEPLLDKSWQRVVSFDEAGPSSRKQDDVMDLDGDDSEGGDWEYEEEEELVTLDLGPDSKRLVQMSQQYSIAGLETETPYMQLGNLMFKGTWDKLIGTEIILKDEVDLSRSQAEQHKLWPLPATETDRKIGRAPSTTRRRILFKQAVNMAAREAALVPPDDQVSQPALWRQAPTLKESKTGLITDKGWVWVRGRGWMRKEDTILLPSKDCDEMNARPAPSSQGKAAEKVAEEDEQEEEEAEDKNEEEDEEGSNEEDDQANETTTIKQEDETLAPGDQTEEQASTSKKRGPYKSRQKMTPEEKARYALLRSFRAVKKRREGQVDVDEEDAEIGDETNFTNAADGEDDDEEEEDE